jgi:hypothetical protein
VGEKGEDLQGPKEFLPLSKLEGKLPMALLASVMELLAPILGSFRYKFSQFF